MENKPGYVWLESKVNNTFFVIFIDENLSQTNICDTPDKAVAVNLVKKLNKELEANGK